MSGRPSGSGPNKTRYYRASRINSAPVSDPILSMGIPAEPLERALIGLLQNVLTFDKSIETHIRAAIEREQKRRESLGNDPAQLRRRRDAAQRKLALAIETLDAVGRDAVRRTLKRLQEEIHTIDGQLKQIQPVAPAHLDVEKTVARVTAALSDLGKHLVEMSPVAQRRILSIFIAKAVADPATRQVEIEIRLPQTALALQESMRLDPMLSWKHGNETHEGEDILSAMLLWFPSLKCFGAVDFGPADRISA